MEGRVTTDGHQALLAIRVLGPAEQPDGESGLMDAVIDTGFTGQLVLPPEAVERLGQVGVILSEDFNPGAVRDGASFANPLDPNFDPATLD